MTGRWSKSSQHEEQPQRDSTASDVRSAPILQPGLIPRGVGKVWVLVCNIRQWTPAGLAVPAGVWMGDSAVSCSPGGRSTTGRLITTQTEKMDNSEETEWGRTAGDANGAHQKIPGQETVDANPLSRPRASHYRCTCIITAFMSDWSDCLYWFRFSYGIFPQHWAA